MFFGSAKHVELPHVMHAAEVPLKAIYARYRMDQAELCQSPRNLYQSSPSNL